MTLLRGPQPTLRSNLTAISQTAVGALGLDAIRRSKCGDHSVVELYLILAFDSGRPGSLEQIAR